MSERKEAFMRIVVLIVSGIVLSIWKALVQIVVVIHWIYAVFANKRSKGLAEFCQIWNCQTYKFLLYISFMTNKRPFPFTRLAEMDKFEQK